MIIHCPNCNVELEVMDGIAEGQHVRCPECGVKFEWRRKRFDIEMLKRVALLSSPIWTTLLLVRLIASGVVNEGVIAFGVILVIAATIVVAVKMGRFVAERIRIPKSFGRWGYLVLGLVIGFSVGVNSTGGSSRHERSPMATKALTANAPFHNLAWKFESSNSGVSSYWINTDGPANATFEAIYIMGRLHNLRLVKADDEEKAEKAETIIRKIYELEGSLTSSR